ncbi:catechol O-methyltransferase A-like isoform X3 [Pelobates fuscus]|uniref:catechol O-methyltransferase A-like isoform X3 n=1 Tax=Pelobates fuscus TaxID=191477 RepID=UPI002FE4DA25
MNGLSLSSSALSAEGLTDYQHFHPTHKVTQTHREGHSWTHRQYGHSRTHRQHGHSRTYRPVLTTSSFSNSPTMLSVALSLGAVLVFFLLLVVQRVRTEGAWALWWHDNYLEKLKDFLSGTTRPVRMLRHVQKVAEHGDAQSVLAAVDSYCSNVEWAMNVGDLKGQILDAIVLETRPRYVLELGTYCAYSTVRMGRLLPPGARLISIEMNPDYAQVARKILHHAGLDTQLTLISSDSPSPSCTQGEQPAEGTEQPSAQRRWRLQEALIYTTLHCLQLPLQLFSRNPPNPLGSSLPRDRSSERQQSGKLQTCKVEILVGSTSDLIPQLKKKLDIDTFDFVFIDHWKVSYLKDTKLLEECDLLRPGSVLLADNVICPGAPEYLHYVRTSPRYESQYFPSQLEYLQVEDGMEKSVFLG